MTSFCLLVASCSSVSSGKADVKKASGKTPVENLFQYTLDNGLDVFVAENHSVPLVYIEIAVKAGAITQTPETAGLFHLYEHMMFKGNELYKDAASVQRAISDLGVTNWNGTTSTNCVNYFFTIPKDQLENGLAFWNAAIRSPLMTEKELENEKKVVLSEIEADYASANHIYSNYLNSHLFPNEPYRTDPSGSSPVVRNATVAQMRDMQSKYYIPSNAALFVGGDVDPDEVKNLVAKIYGTWSNNGNEAPALGKQQATEPFEKTAYAVLPYDKLPPQMAQVDVMFRGPDTDYDIEDTYPIDYMLHLLSSPEGSFKQTLVNDETLGIPDTGYVWSGYGTTRASGTIDFGAAMMSPESNLTERVDAFLSRVQDEILPSVANDSSLYTQKSVKGIARRLRDSDLINAQTAEGLLSNLRFWWICSSPEYYYTYNDMISHVSQSDVQSFVRKYITGKKPLVCVLVNPAVYSQIQSDFAQKGYEVITAENAFWWKQKKFGADPKKVAAQTGVPEKTEIYKPKAKIAGNSSYSLSQAKNVQTYTLNNGIPVYVLSDKGYAVDSVSIAVRGGISHLTPETSGLESALFSMMASSSEQYDYAARKQLSYDNLSSIGPYTKVAGSALTLSTLGSYLDDMLPVLADSFLNPSFEQTPYETMMTDYMQGLQSMMNDPESIMGYEMRKTLFKDHPFETSVSVTPESIGSITIDNMKQLHKRILNAENIFVVAVGSMNGKALVKALNPTIGSIPSDASDITVLKDVPPVKVQGEPVILTHPEAAGTGYVSRMFASPLPTSEDYMPAILAGEVYSGILFNVVREHYGACYTPSSYVTQSKAPLGQENIFKLSNPEHFAEYMTEARNYMAEGKIIDSVADDGTYVLSSLKDRLQSYKNSYIVSTYGKQATTAGVAGSLLYDILSYDDMFFNRSLDAKMEAVTAEQVLDVFNRYWVDGPCQWWLMVGPDMKGRIPVSKLMP